MKKLADIRAFDSLQNQAHISIFNGRYTDEFVKKERREGGSAKERTRFPGFEPTRSYINMIVDAGSWLADKIEQMGNLKKIPQEVIRKRIAEECADIAAAYIDNGFFGDRRVDKDKVAKDIADQTMSQFLFIQEAKKAIGDTSWLDDAIAKAVKAYTAPKGPVN